MSFTAKTGVSAGHEGATAGRNILMAAAWLGCFTGLSEGAGLWVLQQSPLVPWNLVTKGVRVQIFWVAPLVDVILFTAVGVGFAVLALLFRRLPVMKAAIFAFFFLLFWDWLSLPIRFKWYAIAIMGIGLAAVCTRWFEKNRDSILRFWRGTLVWMLATSFLLFVGIEAGIRIREHVALARLPDASPTAPNVIFVVMDTMRADHLSAYGYHRDTSPNFDRLAREGVLFENAYSPSCWSPPSHASLVTGLPLSQHGVEAIHPKLDGRFLTIAEFLRDRGYRTHASSGNMGFFTASLGYDQGFIRFDDIHYTLGDSITRTVYGRRLPAKVTVFLNGQHKLGEIVSRDAIRWIREDSSRPFFLMVNFFDLHAPYLVPSPHGNKFLPKPRTSFFMRDGVDITQLTPQLLEEEMAAYDGAIAYADHQLGTLMDELEKLGIAENTLVIVTSDHGEAFGEHGSYMHRNDLYREVVHVPLAIRWPGQVPANLRISRPVSNMSIAATIERLVDDNATRVFYGPPLTHLWKNPGSEKDWPPPLVEVSQQPFGLIILKTWGVKVYTGWMKSLISPRYQYIVHEKDGAELYDWRNDPLEQHNLAGTPEGEILLRDFAALLEDVLAKPNGVRANHRKVMESFGTSIEEAAPKTAEARKGASK